MSSTPPFQYEIQMPSAAVACGVLVLAATEPILDRHPPRNTYMDIRPPNRSSVHLRVAVRRLIDGTPAGARKPMSAVSRYHQLKYVQKL